MQISTSSWPHDGFGPQMLEDFNISHKSQNVDALQYAEYVLLGSGGYNDSHYEEDIQALNSYMRKNFLKVLYFYEIWQLLFSDGIQFIF